MWKTSCGICISFPSSRRVVSNSSGGDTCTGVRSGQSSSTRLLPWDGSYNINWFVHPAEKPSSRPDWLGKQVSAFPLKSHDFHSLTAVPAFRDLCHPGYCRTTLHGTAAHKLCMPALVCFSTSMQLTGDGICACVTKQSIRY